MPGREEIFLLLENEDHQLPASASQDDHWSAPIDKERREALVKVRARAAMKMGRFREKQQRAQREAEREGWLREQSKVIAVEAELLLPPKRASSRRSMDSGLGWMSNDEAESDGASDDEEDLAELVSDNLGKGST